MSNDLILGTAGHIDHGKTSLIRALTGVDTDRLPEEKKRGITIELGFAHLELGPYRLGIVDVPGHERFVRNMLAGATGIDLALLVVAADDSVKQQTLEHLEILRLLRLKRGVIALTKCDLADPDWIDLVEEEVRDLVSDTFLADAPLIRTSAHRGEGLDELKAALLEAAEQAAQDPQRQTEDGPFRLAIDRTFTIAGHGTVVTGSVSSGRAKVGDELVLQPGDRTVRVRGVQNHDRAVEEVHRGQRAAINLAGVHHDEIVRGQELASPGHLVPSKLLTVRLEMLPGAPRPLKNRARVRCHLGTTEVLASVSLLGADRLEPGQAGYAQLFLVEPVVSTWNQPLVIRAESPVQTIGGGQVLDPTAQKLRRSDEANVEWAARLRSEDQLERAAAAAYFLGTRPWQAEDLARAAGIVQPAETLKRLIAEGKVKELRISPTRSLRISQAVLDQLCDRVASALAKLHEENPLAMTVQRARLVQKVKYLGEDVVDVLLGQMETSKRLTVSDRGVSLAGHGPQLSKNERKLLEEIIENFRTAGIEPPTVDQLQKQATKNQAAVPQLVKLAAADGTLVEVGQGFFLHEEAAKHVRKTLTEAMAGGEGLTLSEIRELLGTSRKYAVPICEYLDRSGFTKREGDLRRLGAEGDGKPIPSHE